VSEAAPISVFVILIQPIVRALHDEDIKVGAVYWNEQAAQDEVDRLQAANSYTRATYVVRQLEWPTFLKWDKYTEDGRG